MAVNEQGDRIADFDLWDMGPSSTMEFKVSTSAIGQEMNCFMIYIVSAPKKTLLALHKPSAFLFPLLVWKVHFSTCIVIYSKVIFCLKFVWLYICGTFWLLTLGSEMYGSFNGACKHVSIKAKRPLEKMNIEFAAPLIERIFYQEQHFPFKATDQLSVMLLLDCWAIPRSYRLVYGNG